MTVITDAKRIDELLERGTEDILVKEHLRERLLSGARLRVKFGIDPTSPNIHLGRAVALRKLKFFQDLGHKVVLIIGDFTARIGDPSDKLEKRPMLTEAEIKKNLKQYLKQIGKIINLSKTEIHYNSKWLRKMGFLEISKLLECFTVQQMSKRRNFHERLEAGQDIFVVEFLYPALQGYDSVEVKADVELGGFDQLFNLKAGRVVQRRYDRPEQDILTVQMLEGTDGRKMSSSWGNVISLLDSPEDMFGKLMSVRDDLIIKYFTLCTDLPLPRIAQYESDLKSGANPKEIKLNLAKEIVSMYHGSRAAEFAREDWGKKFEKGEIPDDIVEIESHGQLLATLAENKITSSTSEARRLFKTGSIHNMTADKKAAPDDEAREGEVYRVGKKIFVKIANKKARI